MRGLVTVLLACTLAVLASVPAHRGHAQPAPTAVDLERARIEYTAAEAAITAGDYNLATNHYANSYRASKDPALLYKIAVARQKAGDCLNAIRLFAIYLRVGKPSDDHALLTRDKIQKCGGDPDADPGPLPADPVAGWGFTVPTPGSGSAEPAGSGSAVGSGSDAGSAGSADPGSGSAEPTGSGSAIPPPPTQLKGRHRAAWLLVGGAIAAATAGAVLAYSSNAAEQDIDDLYVGLGGTPPRFDERTRARFDDLVAEGNRYEKLSWVSFGTAAVLGGLATWRFVTDKPTARQVEVTPTASPTGAGVSATIRW